MTQYGYTVSDPMSGERSSGTLVAPDYEAAFRILTERNYIVTRLAAVRSSRYKILEWLGLMQRSIGDEQLLALTEQVAAMLKAGLTVKASIEIVLRDAGDERFKQLLLEVSTSLGAGASLTEVLSRHPEVFDRQYVALVSAGESGGKLAEVMARLAFLIEKRMEMKKKLQAALYYPAFVLTFAFLIMGALLIFGIPKFEEIYRGFGGEIPWTTRLFVAAGTFVRNNLLLLAVLAVAALIGARRLLKVEKVAYQVDRMMLRLPVVGSLMRRLAIARFARTLGTLHSSGVAIVQSLDLVASSMNNRVLEQVVRNARAQVMEGETLSVPLRRSGCFTEMSLSMIAAGEHSGALDEMLSNIAEYYDTQVDTALRGLASLVEPVVMVIVGLFVGVIMIVLVLPIFKLSTLLMTR